MLGRTHLDSRSLRVLANSLYVVSLPPRVHPILLVAAFCQDRHLSWFCCLAAFRLHVLPGRLLSRLASCSQDCHPGVVPVLARFVLLMITLS